MGYDTHLGLDTPSSLEMGTRMLLAFTFFSLAIFVSAFFAHHYTAIVGLGIQGSAVLVAGWLLGLDM